MVMMKRIPFVVMMVSMVVLAGCDNLLGPEDEDSGDSASPGESLEIPGSTVVGWADEVEQSGLLVPISLADVDYNAGAVQSDGTFGSITLRVDDSQRQYLLTAEELGFEGLTIEPASVRFDVVLGFRSSSVGEVGDLRLRDTDPEVFVEWWYVSDSATVTFDSDSGSAGSSVSFDLQSGWNAVVYETTDDGSRTARVSLPPDDAEWVFVE